RQAKVSRVAHEGLKSCAADGSGYCLLLHADRARSLVEHVLNVRTEEARSLIVSPGDADQLHHTQPVGMSRLPAFVGELPEPAEDARRGLSPEEAEIVEAEIEVERSLHGSPVADSSEPSWRTRPLLRAGPDVDCRVLGELSVPRERHVLSPRAQDQLEIFVEARSELHRRDAVVETGVVRQSDRKPGHQSAAADRVDRR